MLRGLAVFFVIAACVMMAHKLGHYAVGRQVVGIPAGSLRLVVLHLPQYVALKTDHQWVSPLAFEAYLDAYRMYDPKENHLVAFLAAGVLAQTACVVVLAVTSLVAGVSFVGQSAVLVSAMLTSFHLFSDLGARLHLGTPSGDFSALFEQSPSTAVAVLAMFVVSHGLLYSLF